jgi:tetratricopeptide (TPR) repeat protein
MKLVQVVFSLSLIASPLCAQEKHEHPAPEKLGVVAFANSCAPSVQARFERSVALLHSFAYAPAEQAFREVAVADAKCAMAHWGMAMTYYHELWAPQITPADMARGRTELEQARQLGGTERERQFIDALGFYYRDAEKVSPALRAKAYAEAMADVARKNSSDSEAQVFYALALLAAGSPMDKTHANQKLAAGILEPLYKTQPQHPGIAHYLIHAYDNAELASGGLSAARAYSQIAPSAPHALHMPSHIFTRLGLWDDAIASNQAARRAAHEQGDILQELHAMDYLTYAYLQRGREAEAARILEELKSKAQLSAGVFTVAYAATAMPVRYAIERRQWAEAAELQPLPGAAPEVAAVSYWARAVGLARMGRAEAAAAELSKLKGCLEQLKADGNAYWTTQVHVQLLEAQGWMASAQGKPEEAIGLLRSAANEEDDVEKLPVTPGPIVPAREQLAEMLLSVNRPKEALTEFETSLVFAPGRRGAISGAARAAELLGDTKKAQQLRAALL